mgnify:CR=1 FL=1
MTARLDDCYSIERLRLAARARLPRPVFDFFDGGAEDEITLRENVAAFEDLKMTPRVLADVSGGHTRLKLAGETLAHPFILAPVGWQKLFHPQGELASAQAAGVMQAPFAVSCMATETSACSAGAVGPTPRMMTPFAPH